LKVKLLEPPDQKNDGDRYDLYNSSDFSKHSEQGEHFPMLGFLLFILKEVHRKVATWRVVARVLYRVFEVKVRYAEVKIGE
jgi:hypothetical protein